MSESNIKISIISFAVVLVSFFIMCCWISEQGSIRYTACVNNSKSNVMMCGELLRVH